MATRALNVVSRDLKHLVRYLGKRISRAYSLVHDEEEDKVNLRSPRQFCSVTPGTSVIHCSKILANLPRLSRVGVLLHEIGHLEADAFGGDESEVDADLWVETNVPEAHLDYQDVSYRRNNETVKARNLQCVAPGFLRRIYHERP